ncbi:carbohydrate ABC transporter permease [Paramicrobacterium agarici]|uniref:Carbohydrate ABC transporter membrane protein 1 (CUT1 family) n=1 Tax=Paramicrobacterium agarici TaxID=630514 RepID=A0A2A9DVY2_9MICO|nr:sugar ABC transporter permease [Microbacterium agarici]PFG30100.1 carbohydrate ABC transporter membrane protein 1 (CUT1 family) [Microbacterium agarici]
MTATAIRPGRVENDGEVKPQRTKPVLTRRERKGLRLARALVWPALAAAIIITQIPFLVTIYYSFQQWNLLRPGDQKFVWFDNYVTVLTNGAFVSSLRATVVIVGASVLISLVFGMVLALLLDRKFMGQGLARTLLITPFLMMPAAASLIWKWSMLDSNVGMVNWALGLIGIDPVAWNTDVPILTIIMVLTWQYTPFMMLILLAGLQSQPQDVLEAASVDGAGPIRTFFSMTLPHMRQYMELSILLGTILLLQVFDPIAIMTRGTGGTKTLSYLLYERAFVGLEIGEAAAYGVLTVLLTIIVAMVALRSLFKIFKTEGTR